MDDTTPRILAVDDSLTIRKALEMILVPAGYHVELAASGAEAIEKARDFAPAVILLDFILPDMRGSDVCRSLASDPVTKDVPVVLISARGAEIRQAYLDAENVVEYLVKPFTPDEVHAVIGAVLASTEAAEEQVAEEGEMVDEPLSADGTASFDAEAAEMGSASPGGEETADRSAEIQPEIPIAASAEIVPVAPVVEAPIASPAPERPEPIAAASWEEISADAEADLELEEPEAFPLQFDSARRDLIESMFENLRANLEGVYVEEGETAGGGADQTQSYSELATLLARQMGETLEHATSGRRFALGADGSVRSLHDALLDAHRRVCRLLFRAVVAGVIDNEVAGLSQPRLLAVSGGKGLPLPALADLASLPGWNAFHISSAFGQLPMMVRCYGPTHLILDLDNRDACAAFESLHRAGETKRVQVVGVAEDPEAIADETRQRYGLARVLATNPELGDDLQRLIFKGRAAAEIAAVAPEIPRMDQVETATASVAF